MRSVGVVVRRNAAHIDIDGDAAEMTATPAGRRSERIWATLHLGTIALEPGLHTLSPRADRITGRQVMERRSVTLRARD